MSTPGLSNSTLPIIQSTCQNYIQTTSFTKHLTCIERNKTTNCDQEMTNKEKKQETRSTKVKDVMKNKEIKIISLEK